MGRMVRARDHGHLADPPTRGKEKEAESLLCDGSEGSSTQRFKLISLEVGKKDIKVPDRHGGRPGRRLQVKQTSEELIRSHSFNVQTTGPVKRMFEGTPVARDSPVLQIVDGSLMGEEVADYAHRGVFEGETVLGKE